MWRLVLARRHAAHKRKLLATSHLRNFPNIVVIYTRGVKDAEGYAFRFIYKKTVILENFERKLDRLPNERHKGKGHASVGVHRNEIT